MMRAAAGINSGLILLLTVAALTANAQEPANKAEAEPTAYRRLFVPEEDLPTQARGLLPMKRDEFQQRIEAATRSSNRQVVSPCRIESGTYQAAFRDGRLIEGRADLDVQGPGDEKSMVPLGDVNIAISNPEWEDDPPRQALLGLSDAGKYLLQAEGPSQLKFAWAAAGQPADGGGWSFDLSLPQANRTELQLELPEGWTLNTEPGLLQGPSPVAEDEKAGGIRPRATRWTLGVGGASPLRFRIQPPSTGRDESLLLVSESALCRFAPGLLDVDSSLEVSVHQLPLRELALRVDPGMNILSIRVGDQRLAWIEGAPDENGIRRYTVELPEPLSVGSHTFQIAATAEWPTEEQRPVPRINVENGIWQAGTITLIGTGDVQISAQSQDGAREVFTSGNNSTSPAALRFEYFSNLARIGVVASRPKSLLNLQSGLSLAVDSGQATATVISDLSTVGSVNDGNRFEVSAVASRRWIIESVETVPSDLLEDRTLTVRGPDSQRLLVRLRRPLTVDSSARLIVRARRQRLRDGEANSGDLLRFLTFNDVRAERRLISVVATDPTMEPTLLTDAQVERRDPTTLSTYEQSLLESSQGAILIETPMPGSVGRLNLRRNEARYSAEIENTVRVSPDALTNEVRLAIRPEVSSISRVLVRASTKLRGSIEWTVEGDESQAVVAKDLSDMSDKVDGESLLQLQLSRPQSRSVVLVGRWSESLEDDFQLPLLSLPEANSQTGIVQIATRGGASVRVTTAEMSALPLPSVDGDAINPLVARYQYEPGRQGKLTISPRPSGERSPNYLIRERVISSTFSSDGTALHVAEYELDNLGADLLVLEIPAAATIESVEIDGNAASVVRRAQGGEELTIPLPDGVRRPKVTVRYSSASQGSSQWFTSEFRAPLPQAQVPSLHERWRVRLAPGLSYWTAAAQNGSEESPRKAFDLFSRDDWTHFWNSLLGNEHPKRQPSSSDSNELGMGWSEFAVELTDEPYGTVLVYRPVWVSICGIALALAVFGVAGTLPNPYARMMLFVTSFTTAAMFWLSPIPLVQLCWWTLAGIVTTLAWRGLRPSGRTTQATEQLNPSHAGRPSFTVAARLLMLLSVAVIVSGQDSMCGAEEPGLPALKDTPRVVFPVDENEQPTGDYVYLSEDLYEALHQASASQRPSDPSWLVAAATYNLRISEEGGSLHPSRCDLVAEYEIHTFVKGARVDLPLGRGDVHLVALGSTLDESPVVSSWNEGRDVLSVDIADAGRHRLALNFGMAFKRQDETYLASVSIPKVPQSKAKLILDPDRGRGGIGTSSGPAAFTTESGTLETDLAPAGQLHVHYLPKSKTSLQRAKVSAAQRIWWKIRPGSVLAEGRFDFLADSGEIREIVLRTDPRVRLLPLDSDAGIVRQWTEEGPLNTIHLELAPPYPAEASLHARFLLVGAAASGTFVPPAIDVVADRIDRYWEALSATPGWEVEGPSDRLLPTAAFIQAWGGSPDLPDLAWDRTSPGTTPTILIRPSTKLQLADQQLDFSLGRDIGRLFYRADIKQEEQPLLHCTLAVPPELRVRSVAAATGEKPLSARWWQSERGSLTVRFQDAQATSTQLSVEADWELPGQMSLISLPLVKLQSIKSSDYQVRVFRESNVSLKWEDKAGIEPVEDSLLGGYVPDRGRLESHFVADATAEPGLRLRVDHKVPDVIGRLFTAVQESNKTWKAELHCDLEVRSGSLDVMRFELPDHWSGPFEVEPAVDYTLLTLPGQSRKQLVVRPQQAITGRLRMTIRGPLKISSTDTIRAVDVELLDSPLVERYIALAKNAGSALTWETSGLQPVDTGSIAFPTALSAERFEVFRVIADRFAAVGRRAADEKQARRPIVRLADIRVSWQKDRRYFGSARFDLYPERLPDCTLSIPSDCQLASVTLDDAVAEVTPVGPRALRIDLGLRRLPVQLEVAFVGRLPLSPSNGDLIELPAPQLEAIPVERTLWTVRPVSGSPSVLPADGTLIADSVLADLERMASGLSALEKMVGESDTLASVDLQDWASRWNRQYDEAANRVQHSSTSTKTEVAQIMHRLQSQRSKLIERHALLASEETTPAAMDDRASTYPEAIHALTDGSIARLKFRDANRLERFWHKWPHVMVGWVILGVIGLARVGGHKRSLDWLRANAWLAIATFGVGATILFPGNPACWLVALAAAIFGIFLRWPRTALR